MRRAPLAVALLLAFVLPCAGRPRLAVAADKALEGTLVVWSWNIAGKALKELIPGFQQRHPKVTVRVEDYGPNPTFQKLIAGLAAGGAGMPDVAQVQTHQIPSFADKFPEGFVNLERYGAERFAARMDPSKWQAGVVNGAVMSVPWDSGPAGVFWRKDYLDAAGVKAEDVKTWDDYVRAGERIKAATGKKLLAAYTTTNFDQFRIMLNQQGIFYFNEKGEVDLANPKAVRALALIKTLAEKDLIADVGKWEDQVAATKSGAIASMVTGVWYSGTIMDQARDQAGKWIVTPLPAFEPGGNRAANLGGSTLAIPTASKNQDLAFAFIEYALTEPESQMLMFKKYGLFPSLVTTYQDPYFAQPVEFFANQPIWQAFAATIKDIRPANYTGDYPKANDIVKEAFQTAVLSRGDPAAALKKAAADLANATGRKVADTSR